MSPKQCKRCELVKDEADFHKAALRKDGSWCCQPICKACSVLKAREYYLENQERLKEHNRLKGQRYRQENPEWNRWHHIARKYGLTQEDWEKLYDEQLGRCAICRTPFGGIKVCIDHDHLTGSVRGFLCTRCNFAIGYLQDDPERCESAARYLREQAEIAKEVVPYGD